MNTRGRGHAEQQRVLARRREAQAVQLRTMGLSLDRIAASLLPCQPEHQRDPEAAAACPACLPLYSHRSAAGKAINRALAAEYSAGAESREQLRRHQLAQIDALLQPVMRRALTPGKAAEQDAATLNAVRLLDRRARLLGLDAPLRVQHTDELDAQVMALVEQLNDEARLYADTLAAEREADHG